ncbi:TIM-barrel domain-containing protein [Actinorugispora endophytica]|uniref:Alpha-D-xyloside xylohydrolase n=1 Tax=Actinorugispora endophytica TaxID=1605990 RepID=A0A4R6V3N3_9ACTN|nr:TIM-barrel domain-containing protein [Actinorugispora endophytica]TDQ50774.1 alpha-D-xyloside xylohydrolase [Actinorugispora endophytica]
MLYRPPMAPRELFVADPPPLPVPGYGAPGPSSVVRAEPVEVTDRGVELKAVTTSEETLTVRVTASAHGVVRVRLGSGPDAETRAAKAVALVRSDPDAPVEVSADADRIVVATGPLRAEITLDPWHLRFTDDSGRLLTEQDRGHVDISGRLRTLPFGRSTVDGATAYHESLAAAADERFSGLGERFTPLDLRGRRALMWNFDAFGAESDRSYKNVPLYVSSRGYGLLVDTGSPAEFDMGQSTHSCVQVVVPDDLLDYHVIAGPGPREVLNRFNALTSRPALPPKWAFGTWISSGFVRDTQERVMERARTIRERGIPCDVLHLDCYWQAEGHWSDLDWDPRAFPDPARMLADLDAMGFRVCLWINPYVSHRSPHFAEAAERGYFLRDASGGTYVADAWHGSHPAVGIVDFTDPEAAAWYTGRLRPLLEQGVAVFKTDFGEGVPADAVAANGMTGTDLHNVYTLLFNDAVAAVTREVNGHDLVWARSSYLGGQRHSAQWSGDSQCSFPAMAATLRGGLSHGLSGVPFWSHDAGGFNGTPDTDLYVRWAQFGAFSPLVRFHGTTTREPWHFAPEVEAAVVEALRLRYRLMPYLYSAAVESARTGVPLMRALCVDYADDPLSWRAELEYLLGPDLLVAPVCSPEGVRDVYLPPGRWVDHWSGRVHEGGRSVRLHPRLEQVPLFVRLGALVPVAPRAETVPDGPSGPLTLVSWGGLGRRAVIRDVDGDTVVTAVREDATLRVHADGPARITGVEIVPVHGLTPPEQVELHR